jgi:hypothetical protein
MIPVEDVKVGDVFPDLRVTVAYSEPFSDHLWSLECYVDGTNSEQSVTMILPKEHKVNVYRL